MSRESVGSRAAIPTNRNHGEHLMARPLERYQPSEATPAQPDWSNIDWMPAGPPDWARAPAEYPFAAYPNGVLGVPAHQAANPPQGAARQPKLTEPGSANAPAAAAASWSRLPQTAPLLVPQAWPTVPAEPEWSGSDDRPSAGVPNWAQVHTIHPATGFPKPITQNLTEQALRARGIPEPDIAAAIGNPERMKQLIYQTFGAGSAKASAATDDLWSGRTPAEPLVLAPQQHGKGDRLPAGLPSWAFAPGGNPFATAPGSVQGVPAQHLGDESGQDTSANQPTGPWPPSRAVDVQQVLRILRLLTRRR
jgi:hypothetical protein